MRRLVHGIGTATPGTVEAVARALGEDVLTVSRWASVDRSVVEPYEPPPESAFLNFRQRHALDELIRSMAQTARRDAIPRITRRYLLANYGVETVDELTSQEDRTEALTGVLVELAQVSEIPDGLRPQRRRSHDSDEEIPHAPAIGAAQDYGKAARLGEPELDKVRSRQDASAEAPQVAPGDDPA